MSALTGHVWTRHANGAARNGWKHTYYAFFLCSHAPLSQNASSKLRLCRISRWWQCKLQQAWGPSEHRAQEAGPRHCYVGAQWLFVYNRCTVNSAQGAWQIFKKLNRMTVWPSNSTSGFIPKRIESRAQEEVTCTSMSFAASFTLLKRWNNPSVHWWMDKQKNEILFSHK